MTEPDRSASDAIVATPLRIPLPAGRHVVSFRGPVATFPESLVVNVFPGDTVRALFVPAVGGGPRGDAARAQLRRAMERGAQRPPPRRGDTTGRGGVP